LISANTVQAAAAIAQVILAFVLWRATTKYVKLTARYVDLTAKLVEGNAEQLRQVRARDILARRADLVRIRQLVDSVGTSLRALPPEMKGSGVDSKMRTAPLWSREDVDELARLTANALPAAQHHARALVPNLDWLADRVGEVRSTTRESGFRYERLDADRWQVTMASLTAALDGIDAEANLALVSLREESEVSTPRS
jgi:hypothetical protein